MVLKIHKHIPGLVISYLKFHFNIYRMGTNKCITPDIYHLLIWWGSFLWSSKGSWLSKSLVNFILSFTTKIINYTINIKLENFM